MIFESSGFVELLVNQLIKVALYSQLSDAEQIEVDCSVALGQLLQGEAGGLSIHSKGLWLTSDLKLDSLDLDLARLSLSLSGAVQGQLRLEKPLDLYVALKISEESLNRLLNSPMVRQWLEAIVFLKRQQAFSLKLQQASCSLEDERVEFDVEAQLQHHGAVQAASPPAIAASGTLRVVSSQSLPKGQAEATAIPPQQAPNGARPTLVYLEKAYFKPGQVPLLAETAAILTWAGHLVGQRHIETESFSTTIRSITVTRSHLQLVLNAQVRRLDPVLTHLSGVLP